MWLNDFTQVFREIDNKIAIRDIMLSLVYKNRALEALEFKEKFTHKSIQEEQALIAVYLALNDKENLKNTLKNIEILTVTHCQCHYGKESRKKLLIELLQEQISEKPMNEEITKYLAM